MTMRSVNALVADRAERDPAAVALECRSSLLGYQELVARARALAERLRSDGVGAEDRVGILVDRRPELAVAWLGVLDAGAACVPVDPEAPPRRVQTLLSDAQARVVVTTGDLRPRLGQMPASAVLLDEQAVDGRRAEAAPAHERQLAYVVYTSGSTGAPKGVMVPHGALVNHAAAVRRLFALEPGDRVLQLAPPAFDVVAEEIFPTLIAGATLVLAPELGRATVAELIAAVERLRISVVNLATPLWERWVDELAASASRVPDTLRLVVIGTDRAAPRRMDAWRELAPSSIELLNAYGVTETTITSTVWRAPRTPPTRPSEHVPVGAPIEGVRAYVLGPDLRPLPAGESGELYLGGAGVARGYLGRPAPTAERFLPDPFASEPGRRLYATGDAARMLEDGSFELLGRLDDQLKIRGFRVEAGEVEAAIEQSHPVERAFVLARESEDGDRRLVAYVVPRPTERELPVGDLRAQLRDVLPAYMVPSAFVVLDELPLLPSGKVDRRALPEPGRSALPVGAPLVTARTELERELAAIWEEVLAVAPVGVRDDFFELGGHSLLAIQVLARVRERLGVDLPLRALYEAGTVEALAAQVETGSVPRAVLPPLQAEPHAGPAPVSVQQEQVLFLTDLSPGSIAYNAQTTIRLHGRLDVDVLERAVTEIARRHEILRTTFERSGGGYVQRTHPPAPATIPVVDLTDVAAAEREARCEELVREELARSFDVGRLPLVRWTLLRLAPDEHELVLVEHHLVHDGWSFALLVRELKLLYDAFARGEPSPLPELPVQYGDYARWERRTFGSGALDEQLAYWRGRLAGAPEVLDLPTDRPRPREQAFAGDALRVELPVALCERARDFSRAERVTLFATMLAAFATVLGRYSRQDDLCIGSAFANRRLRETEELLGMFVNAVPLRCDLSGRPSFRELVARVHAAVLDAQANQEYPFTHLVEALNPPRDPSRNPIFQAMFSFDDSPIPELEPPGLSGSIFERHNGSAKLDLNVIAIPRAEKQAGRASGRSDRRVTLLWEYDSALFDRSTMERMVEHFRMLLEGALERPETPVTQLPLLAPEERETLLRELSSTARTARPLATIPELYAEQVRRRPEALALFDDAERLDYAELDRRANRLAHLLREKGTRAETLVGIFLERSPDLVVAALAIAKAGGACVPLDPAYPSKRLAFMLQDTAASLVITESRLLDRLPAHQDRTLVLDRECDRLERMPEHPPEAGVGPDNLAYVMYTSGSTGQPKGVMIPHRAIARLVLEPTFATLDEEQVLLQLAPASFDAATLEIWGALLKGGALAVMSPGLPSLRELGRAIQRYGVTTLWLTAPLFHQMAEQELDSLDGVRQLIAGGDVLSQEYVARAVEGLPGTSVVNGYGPTEATTFTACHRFEGPPKGAVPIGRPITDTTVYVVDDELEPVPIGVRGELLVGGAGLARGYLHRPDTTAERFVPDPFSGDRGGRLYRTGDLVRLRADGVLEFVGRRDTQVKIRGHRVEPGEIEAVLREHASVADAVVVPHIPRGHEEKVLVAYIVAEEATPAAAALRDHLAASLPAHMIPASFVAVEELPLTPSGKLDRRRLPEPEAAALAAGVRFVAPRTPVEEEIAELWAAALGRDRVGVHDDFFQLGGSSLLATSIVADLGERFGVEPRLGAFFERPTVEGLARAVEEALVAAADEEELARLLDEVERSERV